MPLSLHAYHVLTDYKGLVIKMPMEELEAKVNELSVPVPPDCSDHHCKRSATLSPPLSVHQHKLIHETVLLCLCVPVHRYWKNPDALKDGYAPFCKVSKLYDNFVYCLTSFPYSFPLSLGSVCSSPRTHIPLLLCS